LKLPTDLPLLAQGAMNIVAPWAFRLSMILSESRDTFFRIVREAVGADR
jgi:hypothetical protein